jgi:hypothetical protein
MRSAIGLFCGACALAAALLAAGSASAIRVDAFRAFSGGAACTATYDYAGAQDVRPRSGVRAKLRAVTQPRVAAGHVAGWLGVGGPGQGPNRSTVWLQAGYSAMMDWPQQIYYEVTLPKQGTRYRTIKAALSPGETHVRAVLEVKGTRGRWQVMLDGKAASPVITLPGSHARFAPQVLAETWNAGTRSCNHYSYSFKEIRMARAPGGSWTLPKAGYVWRNRQNQAVKTARDSFVARSVNARRIDPRNVPPMLGPLASRLTGKRLTAECARQAVPVRERPIAHLILSRTVCELLLGYAIAQPHVPPADTQPGFAVASTALGFLRGVARAARVSAAGVDCRAVGWFFSTLHVLGATPRQALALRDVLLRHRDRLQPRLSFQPGCRFR